MSLFPQGRTVQVSFVLTLRTGITSTATHFDTHYDHIFN